MAFHCHTTMISFPETLRLGFSFVRYALVGAVLALGAVIQLWLLLSLLPESSASFAVSVAIVYCTTFVIGFSLQGAITFRVCFDCRVRHRIALLRYAAITLFGGALTTVGALVLREAGSEFPFAPREVEALAFAVAALGSSAVTFVLQRCFVFGPLDPQ